MRIRLYRDSDKKKVISHIAGILKEFGFIYSQHFDRDLTDIPHYYFAHGGRFWILEDGKKIVGTLGVSKVKGNICKLRRFYISKPYRHRGYGRKLYIKALSFIKEQGYREIWTSTNAKFQDSLKFQSSAGFKRTSRVLWPYKRAGIFHILKLPSK